MTRLALALTLVLWPLTAVAEVLDGPAFDAYTQGKTIDFSAFGMPFGREQYLPDGQVIWLQEGEDCLRGTWYEGERAEICFLYEDDPEPICWTFARGPKGLMAEVKRDGQSTGEILQETGQSTQPLVCPGPGVGV